MWYGLTHVLYSPQGIPAFIIWRLGDKINAWKSTTTLTGLLAGVLSARTGKPFTTTPSRREIAPSFCRLAQTATHLLSSFKLVAPGAPPLSQGLPVVANCWYNVYMTEGEINSGESAEKTLTSLIDNILSERGLDSLEERNGVTGFFLTGVTAIDELVGGIPQETITEISGRPGVGKTSLMMYVAQTQCYKTLYIDAEHRFRNETQDNVVVISENILENIEAIVNDALDSQGFDLIVVDSVASMVPEKFFNDEYANDVGLKARCMARWMQRIPGHLRASHGTAVVFINQLRDTTNAFGTKTFTPGGHALTYACSLRLELMSASSDVVTKNGQKVGQKVRFKVTKNTTGPDRTEGVYKVIYENGEYTVDNTYAKRAKTKRAATQQNEQGNTD